MGSMLGSSAEVRGYLELQIKLRGLGHNLLRVDMQYGDAVLSDQKFTFPVSLDRVEQALSTIWNGSNQRPTRKGVTTSLDPAVDLGVQLFAALFAGPREAFYRQVQEAANAAGQGLRLRFSLADGEAAALPWELLHDGRDFVALSTRTPLVRCIERGQNPLPSPLSSVRILAVVAQTTDAGGGAWAASTRAIYNRLQKSYEPLQYDIIERTTPEQLRQALAAQQYDIVHISGSAGKVRSGAQALALLNEDGTPVLIERDELAALLDRKEFRLICLDACHSDLLACGLATDLKTPAIYGIQSVISVPAADSFAASFLAAVLAGQPLTACVTQGRQAIDAQWPGSREWALPVLYTDSPDGQLVLARGQTGVEQAVQRDVALENALPPPPPVSLGLTGLLPPAPAPESLERQKLQMWIRLKRKNLDVLEGQVAGASYASAQAPEQIEALRAEIADLEQQLSVTK